MQKVRCVLPRVFRSMCESGCVYREQHLVNARCLRVAKSSPCAGPCPVPEPCECRRPKKLETLVIVETDKKRDVFLM